LVLEPLKILDKINKDRKAKYRKIDSSWPMFQKTGITLNCIRSTDCLQIKVKGHGYRSLKRQRTTSRLKYWNLMLFSDYGCEKSWNGNPNRKMKVPVFFYIKIQKIFDSRYQLDNIFYSFLIWPKHIQWPEYFILKEIKLLIQHKNIVWNAYLLINTLIKNVDKLIIILLKYWY